MPRGIHSPTCHVVTGGDGLPMPSISNIHEYQCPGRLQWGHIAKALVAAAARQDCAPKCAVVTLSRCSNAKGVKSMHLWTCQRSAFSHGPHWQRLSITYPTPVALLNEIQLCTPSCDTAAHISYHPVPGVHDGTSGGLIRRVRERGARN